MDADESGTTTENPSEAAGLSKGVLSLARDLHKDLKEDDSLRDSLRQTHAQTMEELNKKRKAEADADQQTAGQTFLRPASFMLRDQCRMAVGVRAEILHQVSIREHGYPSLNIDHTSLQLSWSWRRWIVTIQCRPFSSPRGELSTFLTKRKSSPPIERCKTSCCKASTLLRKV